MMNNAIVTLAKAIISKDCISRHGNGDKDLKRLRRLTNNLIKYEKQEIERCNLENIYRKQVSTRNEVVMLTYPDGKIAYLSKNCADLLGYEPKDLIDKTPWIVHKNDSVRIRKYFNAALNGEPGLNVQYRIVTQQGKTMPIVHSWTPVYVGGKIQLIASLVSLDNG
jgi:PAS domain S-box-containing protein